MEVGSIADGRPVFIDKYAHESDSIVLINRIKPHTSFKCAYKSGLMKMMAIGLRKQHGAQHYHNDGFGQMPRIVEEVGLEELRRKKTRFSAGSIENGYNQAGSIENGYNQVAKLACMDAGDIQAKEPDLLREADRNTARNFWKHLDVLIAIGKEITGAGLDPNVTERFNNEFFAIRSALVKSV